MAPFFWTQKQDIGPGGRIGHGLAYDPVRQRAVLFGGDPGGPPFGDTWRWDGELWTQAEDMGPPVRHTVSMAFDAVRQRVLLFGGASGGDLLGDTWAWDGEAWTQVADTGPEARSGHAIAYDSARDRIVLFGGRAGSGPLGDTWEWDGAAWTQVQDAGPSARRGQAMAFDGTAAKVVLFGGAGGNGTGLNDTWTWDGATWSQVADTGPEPRVAPGMVFAGTIVLFGGINSIDPLLPPSDRVIFGDSWRWDGTAWTRVQDIGPAPRWGHGMAFRSDAGQIVLFGGATVFAPAQDVLLQPGLRRDTWEHPEAVAQPPDGGGTGPQGVEVESVLVNPTNASLPGDTLDVTVTLTGPAPDGGIQLVIAVFFDQGGGNFQSIDPPGFVVPQTMGVAAGDNLAQFQMTRDSQPLTSGSYAVGVGVAGGNTVQGGNFTVT